METLVAMLRNNDRASEVALDLLAEYIESTVYRRTLVTALGQATVAEIELPAVVSKVLDCVTWLVGAKSAALCLRGVTAHRVQHFGCDDQSIVARELKSASVELLAEQQPGAHVPLQRNAVCSGCLMPASAAYCLSLPLQIAGQSLGELCAIRSAGDGSFTEADIAIGQEYAGWAAIAIANANKILAARDIARAERETIVAHLHDNVAQTLSLLNIRVESVEEALNGHASPEVLARLAAVKTTVHEVFGQVRTVLSDIRTPAPAGTDLVTALRVCVEAFQETTGLPVDFVVAGQWSLSETAQAQAINIIREALVNIRRHARATYVVLEVVGHQQGLRILVQDNGVGFVAEPDGAGIHLGLTIMRERARRSGAHLTIDSLPGCGTRISLFYQTHCD